MINRHGTCSMHRLEKSRKIVFLQRLLKLTMRRIKRVDKWTSILESNPNTNGTYYVYVMNCMDNSSDILKLRFENGEWQEFGDEYDRIIAWKNIPEKKIADKLDWLKKHHNELKAVFNYDVEINYDYFEIAESLTECLCEYPHFLWSGDVRYIDKVYVITIIF